MRHRLLVLGASGGIGDGLVRCDGWRPSSEWEWVGLSSAECDVRDPKAVLVRLEETQPDAVLYLSAVNRDGFLHKMDPAAIDDVIGVNVVGLSNALIPSMALMRERGSGTFIYASSVLARSVVAGTGLYAASKAFGERLVRQAAVENAARGVSAVSVRMGYFPVGLWERVPTAVRDSVLDAIPLGRTGTIDELATVIRLALSNQYLTGSVIDLAGGL